MTGYDKSMNGRIAEETALADLNGTDLGDFLDKVAERAA